MRDTGKREREGGGGGGKRERERERESFRRLERTMLKGCIL